MNDESLSKYGLQGWAFFFIAEEDQFKLTTWMSGAKCRGAYGLSDTFVPDVKDDDEDLKRVRAQAICNGDDGYPPCPVRIACAAYAIDNNLTRGVWGGLSSRQRKELSKERKAG